MISNLPTSRATSHSTDDKAHGLHDLFRKFSGKTATIVGSAWAFIIALVTIIVWAVTGPIFKFSDTWQLVINTGTTIVTFLMVFLIQNTQNRDARAIHLKLDELIRGLKGPRNRLVDLEDCTDEELEKLEQEFRHFRAQRRDDPEGDAETPEEAASS
ncbi:MAG TPA: low affinity iron permease family protein [Tepidisphaeraceae bacterium]|jgi:low affinity Fe/Cu permease|nr:low affinity iron permease family protein [Tepidisphaeraceae bacterium]